MMRRVATRAVSLRLIFKLVESSLDSPALIPAFEISIAELNGIYASW